MAAKSAAVIANKSPTNVEPSPQKAVLSAITKQGYALNGAPFSPFLVRFASLSDCGVVWFTNAGTPITFYACPGQNGFLPLGDYAFVLGQDPQQTPVMLLKPDPDNSDALAHPVSFLPFLDSSGSGNEALITYYWPIAPTGYSALGICVGVGHAPDPSKYWCVSNKYLVEGTVAPFWDAAGQGWKGDLYQPAVAAVAPDDQMYLAPTTLLSFAYSQATGTANCWSLVVDKPVLTLGSDAPPVPAEPGYEPARGVGSRTRRGLQIVVVIPCTAASDTNAGATPTATPFYYAAAEPYWTVVEAFGSPQGGTYTTSCMVGTSASASSAYRELTSYTVGADAGYNSGDKGGFTAHVSASYTNEMEVSGSVTLGTETQVSEELTLNLPIANRVLVWQKSVEFVTYRTDGSVLSTAEFDVKEITFASSVP